MGLGGMGWGGVGEGADTGRTQEGTELMLSEDSPALRDRREAASQPLMGRRRLPAPVAC